MPRLRESFSSVSLVRQGKHRFYSLTMPSSTLAKCSFVSYRHTDPKEGFQRELDESRAQEIADYIDSGMGTIPSSIVLSSQALADLKYESSRKSLSFIPVTKAFLILDGQHRVYGFSKAKTAIRVPVVIYEGLSRRDETRLFIDINSKQKGVRPELLLDIKRLADYESKEEGLLRDVYDQFMEDLQSAFRGLLSPSKAVAGKLSRVTFNRGLKPLLSLFSDRDIEEIFQILNAYFVAFRNGVLSVFNAEALLANPTLFLAICGFLQPVARIVKDRFKGDYSVDNFYDVLKPVGETVKKGVITKPGGAYRPILDHLNECLQSSFTL